MRRRFIIIFIFISIHLFFITGCKTANNVFDNTGLDVKSTDGDYSPPHILVHYKTKKRMLDVGEELNIEVSFGTTRDYKNLNEVTLNSASAEVLMKKFKWNADLTNYEEIECSILKKIDDFSLAEFKGTFTSIDNIINVTVSTQGFDNSWNSVAFFLHVVENYSVDLNDNQFTYDSGVGSTLYFRLFENKILLYGSYYDFKNNIQGVSL